MSKFKWMMTVLLALSMIAAACGDDDDADEAASDSASTVEEESEDSAGEEPAEQEEAVEEEPVVEVETNELVAAFDANGDGTVTIGVAAAGPRDDNGYYQSLVNFAEDFSADNGFAPPIVSDNIGPAEAAQAMSDLAQQASTFSWSVRAKLRNRFRNLRNSSRTSSGTATVVPASRSFPVSHKRPTGALRFTTQLV